MEPPGDCSFAGPAAFRFAGASGISAVLFPAGPAAPGLADALYTPHLAYAQGRYSLLYTAAYTCLIQLSLYTRPEKPINATLISDAVIRAIGNPWKGLGDRGKLKPFADSRKTRWQA